MTTATLPLVSDRRYGALALTVLVHAALLLAWMAARRAPPAEPETELARRAIQWIRLAPLPVAPTSVKPVAVQTRRPMPLVIQRVTRDASAPTSTSAPAVAASTLTLVPAPPAAAGSAPTASTAPAANAFAGGSTLSATPAESLAERARRAAGGVDRALRKENRAYITAPHDSPQIRLRRGIDAAAEMAPNAWYEAPKIVELVNPNGDGVRITRVITGSRGTYCINERPPTASIDTIETLGKQSPHMSCPQNEGTATTQAWRTARD